VFVGSVKEQHAAVLLHYTGHGYDKLGAPFWLYRGIKSWLAEHSRGAAGSPKQFSTVFHELWDSAPKPWNREFYMRFFQRRLVARLHCCSRISVANTLRTQRLLEGIKPHKTLWLPIPSNLPATKRAQSGSRRNGRFRIAILGHHKARCATLRAHAKLLRTWDQKNQLASVTLMGKGQPAHESATPEADLLQQCVSRARIEILGKLSPEDVSLSLGRADLFLSHCQGESACESGALMAALAASCPSVLRDGANAAPLNESEHFLASDDSPQDVQRLEQTAAAGRLDHIGNAGRRWYDQYADWKVVAPQFHAALFQEPVRSNPDLLQSRIRTSEAWKRLPLTELPEQICPDRA
jgi:hypothetical protein